MTTVVHGIATVPDQAQPNRLEVQLPLALPLVPTIRASSRYDVWATDYKAYSLVYSCTQTGFFKTEFAWILSRSKVLASEQLMGLRAELGVRLAGKLIPVYQGCSHT